MDLLIQGFRTLIIDIAASAMNWVFDHIKIHETYEIAWLDKLLWSLEGVHDSHEISWVDELRWFLEGKIDPLFNWAYDGSNEEIEAVFNSEIPLDCLSEKQTLYLAMYSPTKVKCECICCKWTGYLYALKSGTCPCCGEGCYASFSQPHLILISRKGHRCAN